MRLRRIETVLGISLSNLDDLIELRTALALDRLTRTRNSETDIASAEII